MTATFPGLHALAALVVTGCALFLFSREKIPLQASCLGILVVLMVGVELFPFDYNGSTIRASYFLAGFSNEALIAICALLIIARGVEISGALGVLGDMLASLWLSNRAFALLATMLLAAFLSAFVNNTPIVVMLLPILVGVAHKAGISPSKILMPTGFATIIGGMTTTIGSSTNLLVVSVAVDLGVPRLYMFDFLAPAAVGAAVGLLYLWLVAPKLVPLRNAPMVDDAPRIFTTSFEVSDGSAIAGKNFAEVRRLAGPSVRILHVIRGEGMELVRLPSLRIRPGDRLSVRGKPDAIKQVETLFGHQAHRSGIHRMPDQKLVELVVTRESPLYDKRFSDLQKLFDGRLVPTGLYRPGRRAPARLDEKTDPKLAIGDIVLVQGDRSEIQRLKEDRLMLILDRTVQVPRAAHAGRAVLIMVAVVFLAAIGLLPIAVSALLGVVLMMLGRCLGWHEVWSALDARLVMLIVTSLALGSALVVTGAADYIAAVLVSIVRDLPPPLILCSLLLLFSLLTEVVTNNSVAVLGTPIAINIAQDLGLPELPFVLAVLFGANMSFMTPIGYQTNLLVMSAGGYRFADFFRVGMPLQLIVWLALSWALTIWYL